MSKTFTFRIETEDVDKIEFLWDAMKENEMTNGYRVNAISDGDLFSADEALRVLSNKIEMRNLERMKNWYSGKEFSPDEEGIVPEYYDQDEMIGCFMRNTHWHTERDTEKLNQKLREGEINDE